MIAISRLILTPCSPSVSAVCGVEQESVILKRFPSYRGGEDDEDDDDIDFQ